MATKLYAIFLMVFCTLLTSFAQVFYKKGVVGLNFEAIDYAAAGVVLIGLIMYAVAAVIMIYAFKHGEVTVLYPIITLSYIWVSLLSVYFFSEVMTFYKWLGVGAIVVGIAFIGFGGKDSGSLKYAEAVE